MAALKSTILKKSTSDNMTILMEKVLENVINSDSPNIKKDSINWGGYKIHFEEKNWKFSKPDDETVHEGLFPSGLGHVSSGIKQNINAKFEEVEGPTGLDG